MDKPAAAKERVRTHVGRGSAISGWASALPGTVVTNEQIMTLFDTTNEWIMERTGIRERRAADGPFVNPKPPTSPPGGMGTTAQLAAQAGATAMSRAGVTGADIDLLVLCTTSPDQLVPATSSALAHALGIKGGGMDINAACAGFTMASSRPQGSSPLGLSGCSSSGQKR